MKKIAFLACISVAGAAQAATLTSVGVLDPNFPSSTVRAVKVGPDGTVYAVGGSRSDTWSHYIPPGQTEPTQSPEHPFVWDSINGIQELVNPSGIASYCNGVDIRSGQGTGGVDQILIGGMIGSISRTWKADIADPTSGVWTVPDPAPEYTKNFLSGAYNQIRVAPGMTQVGPTAWPEVWYMPYTVDAAKWRFGRLRGDPRGVWDVGTVGDVSLGGVSATGVVVGTNRDRNRRAIYSNIPAGIAVIPGDGGLRSEGFGVSGNGQWFSGLDYSDTTNVVYEAFVWEYGTAGMILLGQHGPCDTRSVAYAVNNDRIAVGMSWNPSDGEVAVVWDNTGLWDSTGQARRITELLSANGVDTSAWTKLNRALSISDDGMVIAGYGTWAADGSGRGFVARLTEPLQPVPITIVGACCVGEGPEAGTCRVVTAAECANIPYGYYRGDNFCCDSCPGACCKPDAPWCSIELAADCEDPSVFRGPSTLCEETTCQGACCVKAGQCEELANSACPPVKFKGVGTVCEEDTCPCSIPFADADGDGDVDQADFAFLQTCYTGILGGPAVLSDACACMDRVDDDQITGDDVAAFEACATGPGVTWVDGQLPSCVP